MPESSSKSPNQAYFLEISEDMAGQRIDNFLVTHLKGVPKSHVYRILRKGEVRVNKGRIRANYRLQANDSVRIPPIRQAEAKPRAAPNQRLLSAIEQSIIYEDKALLVINKPSGIAVHGGSGISYGVIEAFRTLRPEAHYLELVHRLDRDTSGCLLIAKRRSALRHLHEQFRDDGMDKHYLALVQGHWTSKAKVDLPLQKNTLRSGERIVIVSDDGKPALSIFQTARKFAQASLMDVTLKTGRTHQIRVHAAHMGHPIAGDEKYGNKEFDQEMKARGLDRLFLHARSLSFMAPGSEKTITVTAPLEDKLENVLKDLASK